MVHESLFCSSIGRTRFPPAGSTTVYSDLAMAFSDFGSALGDLDNGAHEDSQHQGIAADGSSATGSTLDTLPGDGMHTCAVKGCELCKCKSISMNPLYSNTCKSLQARRLSGKLLRVWSLYTAGDKGVPEGLECWHCWICIAFTHKGRTRQAVLVDR